LLIFSSFFFLLFCCAIFYLFFFFFFSSRRRHTRCYRDWSSDVCSSDLLLRVEDLDVPRVVPGSAAGILRTLQRFGFEWDGEVVYQSARRESYAAALDMLRARGLTFECACSRAQLAEEARYPGICRANPPRPGMPTATRLRV